MPFTLSLSIKFFEALDGDIHADSQVDGLSRKSLMLTRFVKVLHKKPQISWPIICVSFLFS